MSNDNKKVFDPRSRFGTSKKKETEGAVIDLGDGAKIKLRRQSYPPAAEFLRKSMRPHKKAIEIGTLPEAVAEKMIIECLADFLIVSWEGFYEPVWEEGKAPIFNPKTGELEKEGVQQKDGDGKPLSREVTFSKVAARKILKELPDFRALIWGYSESADMFRRDEDEEDAKN